MSCPQNTQETIHLSAQNGSSALPAPRPKRLSINKVMAKARAGQPLSPVDLDVLKTSGSGAAISRLIASGVKFSVAELIYLGNPTGDLRITAAHKMAEMGHVFSVDEILELHNPLDAYRWSIAHYMSKAGHRFSVRDLVRLGDPADNQGRKVSDLIISRLILDSSPEAASYWRELLDPDIWAAERALHAGQEVPVEIVLRRPDLLSRCGLWAE